MSDRNQNPHVFSLSNCYTRHVRIGITCYPTYGGSGIVATELGLELANRGHQIHFITYANPIRLGERSDIFYHEVEVTTYPLFQYPPYCLALASRMAEVAVQYELDALHVHYAIPHSISAMLARGMLAAERRLPFVTTLHGTDITLVGADRSYFPITRYSILESDAVTSISHNLRQQTVDTFAIDRQIHVIHNFVNPALYCPGPKTEGGARRMIHLSNFRRVKRVQDCVRVLAEVRKSVDAELWMAGDGPERGAAEQLAQELGVIRSVRFLGKRNDVPALLREASVLLMPSEMESFGLAALEGMASGVVPIGTKVGGVPELIRHGDNGFLCDVGDVEAMAECAVRLFSNRGLLQTMAAAARKDAEERFSTDLIIPRYEALYRSLIEK
jgi:N-acetyl-alpha-D-glucosaminyl L-malate synthase BshA